MLQYFPLNPMVNLVSAVIGYSVIAGSATVKLPSIRALLKSKDSSSVSLTGSLVEALQLAITVAASLRVKAAFSLWGENAFILAQVAILSIFIVVFAPQRSPLHISGLLLTAALCVAVFLPALGAYVTLLYSALALPLYVASRFPQIITLIRTRDSRGLSAASYVMTLAGNAARMVTVLLVPRRDSTLLAGAAIPLGLNLATFCLIRVFRPGRAAKAANRKQNRKRTQKQRKQGKKD
jgi:uncharacterized protein with PQ loop repeat